MKNQDMPALTSGALHDESADTVIPHRGLTKREYACIKMGVPKTGDEELDAIILEGNWRRDAGVAMQGILASVGDHGVILPVEVADEAENFATALMNQLDGVTE